MGTLILIYPGFGVVDIPTYTLGLTCFAARPDEFNHLNGLAFRTDELSDYTFTCNKNRLESGFDINLDDIR